MSRARHEDALRDLIPLIYQAALAQPPWRDFLAALRSELRLHHCSISFFTGVGFADRDHVTVSSGDGDLDYDALADEYADVYRPFDPLSYDALAAGHVHVHTEADYLARGEQAAHFFREFMAPHGFDHLTIVKPQVLEASYGGLLICARQKRVGAFSADEVTLLSALNPHLSSALQHFSRMKRTELERDLHEQTIDHLQVGSVLIDLEAKVVRCNPYAERLLARLDGIAIVDQRFSLTQADTRAEFEQLLATFAQPTAPRRIQVMRVAREHGEDIRLMFKPVLPTATYYNTQRPQVMIYLQDTSAQATAPASLIADLFGLTRAEAQLAIHLARGLTLQEAAVAMHISEHTARNYSKRIFAKTGTRRQVELVRVMLHSVALLGGE